MEKTTRAALFDRSSPLERRDIFFRLFTRHFDAVCAATGIAIKSTAQANLDVVAALLVCLRRLNRRDDLQRLGAEAIRQMSNDFRTEWYQLLLRFLFDSGTTATELLLAASRDSALAPRRRLEAYFYIGELQLCTGNVGDAATSFLSVMAAGLEVHESRLASEELAYIRSPLPREITTQTPGQLLAAGVRYLKIEKPMEAVQHLRAASVQSEICFGEHDKDALLIKWTLARAYDELGEHRAALSAVSALVEHFGGEHTCPEATLSRYHQLKALVLSDAGESAAALSVALQATRIEERALVRELRNASTLASHVVGERVTRTASEGVEPRDAIDSLVSIVVRDFPNDAAAVSAALEAVIRRKMLRRSFLDGEAEAARNLRQSASTKFVVDAAEGELLVRRSMLAFRREAKRVRESKEHVDWASGTPEFMLAGVLNQALAGDRQDEAKGTFALIKEAVSRGINDALDRTSEKLDQVKIERIRANLPKGYVWVEMFRYRRNLEKPLECYAAFVVTSDDSLAPTVVQIEDAKRVAGYLHACVSAVERGEGLSRSLTEEVRAHVFDPIRENFGSFSRILIAGDGVIHSFPFDILPLSEDKYVIDIYHISYLNCGVDILEWRSRRPWGPPVIITNPDFDYVEESVAGNQRAHLGPLPLQGTRLQPLHATELEGRDIHAIVGGTFLHGAEATKSAVMRVESPRLLHVATHGFAAPFSVVWGYWPVHWLDVALQRGAKFVSSKDQELDENCVLETILSESVHSLFRSCLAFAGVNAWVHAGVVGSDTGTGVLTALEAMSIDVSETELVVLSACETGRGDVFLDTVAGLRRTFFGAGAICVALWSVPDEETRSLMTAFYRLLHDGVDKSEALWRAKRDARSSGSEPLCWGAFILVGDFGPMRFNGR